MKKLIYMVVAMLCTITTTTVAAQSNKGGELITNRGIAFIMNDVNTNEMLHPGVTAGQWKNVLRTYVGKKFPGESLETVYNNSIVVDGTQPKLFNTYWFNGAAHSTSLMTINKAFLTYNGEAWAVIQCAQMIGSDAGLIDNSIKEGLASGQVEKNNNLKNENDMSNVVVIGVETATQQTNYGPWWMWVLIVLGAIILALILRPSSRQNFIATLRDAWAVEDEVLTRNQRRIRAAADFQAEQNDDLFHESERQRNRYGRPQ